MENTKAFPDPMRGGEKSFNNQTPEKLDTGMDLRDYFAAKAMNSFYAGFAHAGMTPNLEPIEVAKKSYDIADAMIEQRNQTNND